MAFENTVSVKVHLMHLECMQKIMQSGKLSGGLSFIISTFFCDNLRKKFGSETKKMQEI